MTDSWYTLKLSKDSLNKFFENEVAFYGLPRERISNLLLAQLYVYHSLRIQSIYDITDEIKYLEGITERTSTVEAGPFTRGKFLKGFWKKHFFNARFIPRNLRNYLSSTTGRKAFEDCVSEAFSQNQGDFIDEKTLNTISYFVTFGAFQRKSALTGEWIIFGKYNGQNYYLCIASHREGDETIRNKILNMCSTEFPFLSELFVLRP